MRVALLGIARAYAWRAITIMAEGPAQFAVLGHYKHVCKYENIVDFIRVSNCLQNTIKNY